MSRKPNSWTPLTKAELRRLEMEYERVKTEDLCKTYEEMRRHAGLFGRQPCKPWVIQTLVQVWREIYRRYPKGRG